MAKFVSPNTFFYSLVATAPAPESLKNKFDDLFSGNEEALLFRFPDGAALWLCEFSKNIVFFPADGDTMEQAQAIYERLGNSYFEQEINALRLFSDGKGERYDKYEAITGKPFEYEAGDKYPEIPADLLPIDSSIQLKREEQNKELLALSINQWKKLTKRLDKPAVFWSKHEVVEKPYKYGLCKYSADGNLVELPADNWDEAQFLYVEQTRKLYVDRFTRRALADICTEVSQRFNYYCFNYQFLTTENGESVIKCGYYFTPKK